jgi:hypothetical protein
MRTRIHPFYLFVICVCEMSQHVSIVLKKVPYDMVCGLDHQMSASTDLYDVWVNRDLDGHPLTRSVMLLD